MQLTNVNALNVFLSSLKSYFYRSGVKYFICQWFLSQIKEIYVFL